MSYDIFEIQRRLNDLGFGPLVVDGDNGPKTSAAITAFKRSVGLRARPKLGPITWSALMDNAAEKTTAASNELPWAAEAKRIMGLHERRNYSRLKKWFAKSVQWIDPREIPWCGAYVATVMRKWKPGIRIPENPLVARNWLDFGIKCTPQYLCFMIFWRGKRSGWSGHVGFYVGEDATHYYILGGNQSNAVTITRISKNRFLEARFPHGVKQTKRIVRMNRNGVPISTNEA